MNMQSVLRGAGLGALLVLAGCGSGSDLSRSFGFSRDAPDEFVVTTRAPLSMPPDYTLRPPQPGASRPQEQAASQSAQIAIAGSDALTPSGGPSDSPGQDALLAAAGAPAPADIRAKVNSDAAKVADDRSLVERLVFWKPAPLPGTVVDPQKEADRLRDNAALGKAPDSGDTPIIQKKSKGLIDTLF